MEVSENKSYSFTKQNITLNECTLTLTLKQPLYFSDLHNHMKIRQNINTESKTFVKVKVG